MIPVYVIDASALVLALIGKSETAVQLRDRLRPASLHAPHLIDAEVGNVLRRHERNGEIDDREGALGLAACGVLVDHRHPHVGELAELAWARRANLTFYDALYVALAVRLGVTLLTMDRRILGAPNPGCRIELV